MTPSSIDPASASLPACGWPTDPGVVVKIHRWNVSIARLAAVQQVQATLFHKGLPVPRPVAGPEAILEGIAIIEELLPGDRARTSDPGAQSHG